jgi:hypothetical protein
VRERGFLAEEVDVDVDVPVPIHRDLAYEVGGLFNFSSCALQPYFVFQDSVERFISDLEGRVGVSLGRNGERGEGRGRYRAVPYPSCVFSFMGRQVCEFKFLLQTLEFAVWNVGLVGGDGCWHFDLLLYLCLGRGRGEDENEKGREEQKQEGNGHQGENLGKWEVQDMEYARSTSFTLKASGRAQLPRVLST